MDDTNNNDIKQLLDSGEIVEDRPPSNSDDVYVNIYLIKSGNGYDVHIIRKRRDKLDHRWTKSFDTIDDAVKYCVENGATQRFIDNPSHYEPNLNAVQVWAKSQDSMYRPVLLDIGERFDSVSQIPEQYKDINHYTALDLFARPIKNIIKESVMKHANILYNMIK